MLASFRTSLRQPASTLLKTCSKCGGEKSLDDFYNRKRSRDGKHVWCKDCCKAYNRDPANKKRKNARQRERYANDAEYRQSQLDWAKEKRQTDPEYMRRLANESYHRNFEKNREARNERSRKWREDNPEKAKEVYRRSREKHIERARKACREWQKKNPERVRELVMRYHARKLGATVGIVDYEEILERDGLWCYLCDSAVEPDDIHFDHVVPLSKGGEHSMENIRVTHSLCNLTKADRLVEAA